MKPEENAPDNKIPENPQNTSCPEPTQIHPSPESNYLDQQQFQRQLQQIWEKHKHTYNSRIEVVEQASQALINGNLTQELREDAVMQVHTLRGSLGSLGMDKACSISQEIQHLFQQRIGLTPTELETLQKLVIALKTELR